jgi:hypothetical protein
MGLTTEDFTVGHTVLKAASSKVVKHERACSENQHVFIPFAFETCGFLAPEVVDVLNRVQRVMHTNVVSPRSQYVVFKMITFAIQKGYRRSLLHVYRPLKCNYLYFYNLI